MSPPCLESASNRPVQHRQNAALALMMLADHPGQKDQQQCGQSDERIHIPAQAAAVLYWQWCSVRRSLQVISKYHRVEKRFVNSLVAI